MSSVVSSVINPIGGLIKDVVGSYTDDPNIMQTATPEQLKAAQDAVTAGQTGQADLVKALQAQNGLQNQSSVFNQQQAIANGQGPNPAQAMLNNATGANVANQASLMAGQRGASANPALIARQAAMQGANTQQQAAGQGAALQAQQSLGALNQMGSIAGQQANQLGNAVSNQSQSALQGQSNLIGGANNMNQIEAANQAAKNAAAGQMFGQLMGAAGTAISGIPIGSMFSGGGGAAAPSSAMQGSIAQRPMAKFAEGGQVKSGPQSSIGRMMMANGGPVQAIVSPGEKYLDPNAVQQVAKGANPMKAGETIPGKPKVGGAKDSYANDIVPKTLESGGIVLPRSVTQAKDADAKAHAFVQAILNKKAK